MSIERKTISAGAAALLALLVTAVWGFNFVVIQVGLAGVPPLFLATLRFVLSAFPALLFVRFPASRVGWVAVYGVVLGVGEFGLLFTSMKLGAPAGLSSIVLQVQAFFTALLAWPLLKERLSPRSVAGMAVAFAGLGLIALERTGSGLGQIPGIAMAFMVGAAFMWALANIVVKKMGSADALGLMVWSSVFSPLPLFLLSLLFEGWNADLASLRSLSLVSGLCVAYLAFASTLLGYGLWNKLIAARGATSVAPFSLLVPIFGTLSAALCLGERFGAADAAAGVLILGGLAVHAFGDRILAGAKKARKAFSSKS